MADDITSEDPNYDIDAARAAGVQPDERGHLPDTYKMPGHITFSDESIYSTPENPGGHWSPLDDAGQKWAFTPSATNLQNYSPQQLQDYFTKYEPDSTLVMPGAFPGYASGGTIKGLKMPASEVLHKFKVGALHSGSKSGPTVKNRSQAIAIMLSEKRAEQANGGKYPEKANGGTVATAMDVSRRLKRAAGGYNWQTRAEALGLARSHVGPIMSAVPGRTDRHNINVPSGSYVLPADHVSSLGQGNTMAGVKVLNNMFSKGPYGMGGAGGIKHGAGPPKPPPMMKSPSIVPNAKPMGLMADSGGARGEGQSGGVPVVVAGGEYVIPPHIVAQIGDGDLKKGHAALDAWIINHRKKHVKTLQKLPGPAKS